MLLCLVKTGLQSKFPSRFVLSLQLEMSGISGISIQIRIGKR